MSLNHFMGELYLDSTEQASKICEALKLGIAEEGSGPLIQIPKRVIHTLLQYPMLHSA